MINYTQTTSLEMGPYRSPLAFSSSYRITDRRVIRDHQTGPAPAGWETRTPASQCPPLFLPLVYPQTPSLYPRTLNATHLRESHGCAATLGVNRPIDLETVGEGIGSLQVLQRAQSGSLLPSLLTLLAAAITPERIVIDVGDIR